MGAGRNIQRFADHLFAGSIPEFHSRHERPHSIDPPIRIAARRSNIYTPEYSGAKAGLPAPIDATQRYMLLGPGAGARLDSEPALR
jgi:hypothetical protein